MIQSLQNNSIIVGSCWQQYNNKSAGDKKYISTRVKEQIEQNKEESYADKAGGVKVTAAGYYTFNSQIHV